MENRRCRATPTGWRNAMLAAEGGWMVAVLAMIRAKTFARRTNRGSKSGTNWLAFLEWETVGIVGVGWGPARQEYDGMRRSWL